MSDNYNSSGHTTVNIFPPIADLIQQYCPTSAKGKNKFHCPVCNGDDLSINKDGQKWDCMNFQGDKAHRTEICNTLNDLWKMDNPIAPSSNGGRSQPRKKSERELNAEKKKRADVAASIAASEVEMKVEELAYQFDPTVKRGTYSYLAQEIDRWAKEMGHSGFHAQQLLRERIEFLHGSVKPKPQSTDDEDLPRFYREYLLIKEYFGDRLRFNTLTNTIEIDGKPMSLEHVKLDLMVDHGLMIKSGEESVLQIVKKISTGNAYNPVQEYLDRVYEKYGDDTSILEGIAERYFGTSDPIHFVFLACQLLAGAARIYEPGCKHDEALILKGDQGARKSSFIKVLCGAQWFDDSMGDYGDKDEVLKLHRCWMMEWAELETIFRRKDISRVKGFLAADTDIVRPPYGRVNVEFPRRSIIWGTTNQDEFLADATGNRRFWVVDLPKGWKIPIDTLKQERDRIWAAIVALYKHDKQERDRQLASGDADPKPAWTLRDNEDAAANAVAETFQSSDPWTDAINNYLVGKSRVTAGEILINAIKMDIDRQDKAAQMRVADTLRQQGWRSTMARDGKKRIREWRRDELSPNALRLQPTLEVENKVENNETLAISRFFPFGYKGYNLSSNGKEKEVEKIDLRTESDRSCITLEKTESLETGCSRLYPHPPPMSESLTREEVWRGTTSKAIEVEKTSKAESLRDELNSANQSIEAEAGEDNEDIEQTMTILVELAQTIALEPSAPIEEEIESLRGMLTVFSAANPDRKVELWNHLPKLVKDLLSGDDDTKNNTRSTAPASNGKKKRRR